MVTGKNVLGLACAAAFALLTMTACDFGGGDGKEQADSLAIDKTALSQIANETDILTGATMEQRKTMYRILKDLDEIADDAFLLESERESHGTLRNRKMADHIMERLRVVGREIEDARRKATDNERLLTLLDELEQRVEEREAEIRHLKSVVWEKEQELQKRLNTLQDTYAQLKATETDLNNTYHQLANEQERLTTAQYRTWSNAGDLLVEGYNLILIVKENGRLVRRVREAKRNILQRAIYCYETARDMGDPSASQKISATRNKFGETN